MRSLFETPYGVKRFLQVFVLLIVFCVLFGAHLLSEEQPHVTDLLLKRISSHALAMPLMRSGP